ncbi:universal stress protein [Nonomuraea sp. NN258]|uniref:universal stress protein n=1 Tax=Nonomuraea antri TaxID=2730852 RepID=UPI001568DB55|nr:universal stress protein [Nonomuraea antri]NRQ33347.1 universal stress protein [Nonomuraea antri]
MIIVGADGSRTGLDAVAWAAREAALRRMPLTVANVVPKWVTRPAEGPYAEVGDWMRDGGESVLNAAVDHARQEAPGTDVQAVLLPGDPRAALIEAAKEADLLVVGCRGHSAVRGLLVGSVAYGVAAHATVDTVLVQELHALPRGEIVVGVDGSDAGRRAVGFAFQEAGLRVARLRAVQAWAWPQAGGFDPADEQAEREARRTLSATLAEFRERHPDVPVSEELSHGHPVEVLKEASATADLLVVGTRGHGTFAGLVMGSVSQAMLHHAGCPVAVIRARPGEERP